jgi:alpha-L-arabinofuranosidase
VSKSLRVHSTSIFVATAIAVPAAFWAAPAQTGDSDAIAVQVDRPGGAIQPTMFGIFFEDINFGADGGIYPERVKNRSFEFSEPLSAWTKLEQGGAEGELDIRTEGSLNENNPHYLRIRIYTPASGFGVTNSGFRGMGVEAGKEYTFSAYVRAPGGSAPQRLRAALIAENGKTIGEASLSGFTNQWKKYEVAMRPSETAQQAHLNVFADQTGEIDVDMVSLYPKDTFSNRPNGLRPDLAQLLADLKPGFVRFPGGCIVEGKRLETRYQWKKTVGDVSERKTIVNRWNDEFAHRPAPDYFQSFGLGFFEYFQLAEDIGASPLPIINCGMACQFNSAETAGLDQLDPFVQDALDLIEFANSPTDSRWGGLRARLGHPAPFNLKMIGIGNEQWGPRYVDRYKRFADAIRSRYPGIATVVASGPAPSGKEFDFLWGNWRQLKPDIVDEHYYMSPKWFLDNTGRYDRYDRNGPKVFAGEYAAQTVATVSPENRNNWEGAIAEAAFLTGLERNADVVFMSSYAPLLAHVDAWQWKPDLIWFDNLRSFGTPNYYVQKLYATNLGSRILPVTIDGSARDNRNRLYASASLDEKSNEVILKLVNALPTGRSVQVALDGIKSTNGPGRLITLASSDLRAENSLAEPEKVAPVTREIAVASPRLTLKVGPNSLTVLRVGVSR